MFIKLIIFCIGAIIGSFLNVVIYRLPRRESLILPASHCPKCGERLRWFDNIPILSFILLAGKCRHCKEKVPIRYFIVEVSTALLFVIIYLIYGFGYEFLFYIILVALLLVTTFTDLEKGKIPNKVVLVGAGLGLYLSLIFWPLKFFNSLIGFLAGGGIMLFWALIGKLLFKKEGLGSGDIKLAAMIGIFLGIQNTLLALFLTFLIATVISLTFILSEKLRWDSKIPLAPFMAVGTYISLLWGDQISECYFNMVR